METVPSSHTWPWPTPESCRLWPTKVLGWMQTPWLVQWKPFTRLCWVPSPSWGMGCFISQKNDACTKLLEMQGPLKDMFPAFWDLFRTPDEDPLAGILVMHKVQTKYKATICLHDLPMGMMSKKGQMGGCSWNHLRGWPYAPLKEHQSMQ